MKKIILFLVGTIFYLPNAYAQTDAEKELDKITQNYISYLESEGFRPEIDTDGDIEFKSQGTTFFIKTYDTNVLMVSTFLSLEEGQKCSKNLFKMFNDFHFQRAGDRVRLYDCDLVEIQSTSLLVNPNDWEDIIETTLLWLENSTTTFSDLYTEMLEDAE